MKRHRKKKRKGGKGKKRFLIGHRIWRKRVMIIRENKKIEIGRVGNKVK